MKTFFRCRLPAWKVAAAAVAVVLLAVAAGCGSSSIFSYFSWSLTPDRQSIAPGGEAVFNVTVESKENINAQVALRVEGLPSDWTARFDTQPLPDTATGTMLTVRPPNNVELGTYSFTVFAAEAGGNESSRSAEIIVETSQGQPDFTLELDPAELTLQAGGSTPTLTYFTRPLNGFAGTVTVSVSGLTDDLVISSPPTPQTYPIGGDRGGAGGTFVLRYQPQPPVQSPVDVVVTATSGNIVHSRTLRVTLPAQQATPGGNPDIEVSVSPETNTLLPGPSGITFAVTVRSLNNFSGTATVTIDRTGLAPLFVSNPDPPTVSVAPGVTNFGRATFRVLTEVPLTRAVEVPIVVTAGSITKRVHVTVTPPP